MNNFWQRNCWDFTLFGGTEINEKLHILFFFTIINDHKYKQLQIKEKQIAYLKDSELDEKSLQLNLEAEKGYGDDDVDTSAISAELLKEFTDSLAGITST